MSKLDYPRRTSGLYRKAETPNPPAGQRTPAGAFKTKPKPPPKTKKRG